MIQLDTAAIIIGIVGLLSGFVAFLTFVSSRPTRTEVAKSISDMKTDIKADLNYIRGKVDELAKRKK